MRERKYFEKFIFFASFLVLSIYFFLFTGLFFAFDWKINLDSYRIVNAIKNSLLAAILSTFLAFIIGTPTAYFLSRYKHSISNLIDTILEFPLIISPAALGATVVIFFNTPLGQGFKDFFLFNFSGIVLAQFLTVLGLFIRILKSSIDQIDPKYELIASLFGANKIQVFLYIVFPMSKKGLIAAIILSLAKSFGEFGATLMVAGSIAYKTETLPIYLYYQLSTANISQAIFSILILITIAFSTIIIVKNYTNKTNI